jgi:rSAM/selenodomain-associated transferase 1
MGYRQKRRPQTDKIPSPQPHRPWPHRRNAERALIIFAKAPIPGEVKTRLCPLLTPDEAATLHGSMILDMLERTGSRTQSRGSAAFDRFLGCAPSADHVFFKIMEERHHVRLLQQTGEDLGSRMREAFRTVFELGYQKVVLIGTDVPSLSTDLIHQGFDLLSSHNVVLGPALDGGYYLIGLQKLEGNLFTDIPWSTDRVCTSTQEKARTLQLSLGLLPLQRDLDTVEDVLAVQREGVPVSTRTRGVLASLAERIRTRKAEVAPGQIPRPR